MANQWWRHLKGRPFYWAVDGTHPGADVFVLHHVMGRPKRSRGMKAARLALQESPQVERLITRLGTIRRLGHKTGILWERYESVLWTLSMLAELGVRGDDERIAEALDWALDQDEQPEEAPTNANAIVLHIALGFRFSDDERVQRRLSQLSNELRASPPLTPDNSPSPSIGRGGWGVRAAVGGTDNSPSPSIGRGGWGVRADQKADWLTLAAMALAEQPKSERDTTTLALLADHLKTLNPAELPRYQQHGFPTFDQPDDLVLAQAALRLDMTGKWLQPWIERIENAQDNKGLWRLNRALPTPGAIAWEKEGQPSRWISAKAMYVLRAFYGE